MSELEYSNQYASWLTAAGITPATTPINLRGVVHQILQNLGSGGGTGTVTTVSVATANGLAGTVATPTVTPVITMSTTITGVLKGNGAAISAATAGSDYVGPTTGSAIQKASSGGLTAASAGTDYPATGVIAAAGPIGSAGALPVITYNANGQLTTVTTTGTVGSIAATDTSIVIGGTGTAPTIATGTLDVIATQHPPAASVPFNNHKATGQAAATVNGDSMIWGQSGTLVGARTIYSSASQNYSVASATTLAAIDTTNLTVSFVAPPSGNVLIEVDLPQIGFLGTGASAPPLNTQLFLAFFTHGGTTQISESIMAYEMAVNAAGVDGYVSPLRRFISVTGLSSGTSYQWDLAWAASAASGDMLLVVSHNTTFSHTAGQVGSAILSPYAA